MIKQHVITVTFFTVELFWLMEPDEIVLRPATSSALQCLLEVMSDGSHGGPEPRNIKNMSR